MSYRADIKDDVVVDMYVNQGISASKIADFFGVSMTPILTCLRKHNIDIIKGNHRFDLHDDVILNMYVSQGMSANAVADALNTNRTTILNRLRKYNAVRKKWKIIDLSPSSELSYVIGAMLGDGWLNRCKKNHYVCLTAKDEEFVKHFAHCMTIILGSECRVWIDKNGFYNARSTSKMLFEYLQGKNIDNFIDIISERPTDFIRGFFDAEGNVRIRNGKKKGSEITLTNTNFHYLEVIKYILSSILSISSTITLQKREHPGWKDCYKLSIRANSQKRFAKEIGSTIARKQERLKEIEKYRSHYCLVCGIELEDNTKVFCTKKCSNMFFNRKRNHNLTREQTIEYFKKQREIDA